MLLPRPARTAQIGDCSAGPASLATRTRVKCSAMQQQRMRLQHAIRRPGDTIPSSAVVPPSSASGCGGAGHQEAAPRLSRARGRGAPEALRYIQNQSSICWFRFCIFELILKLHYA